MNLRRQLVVAIVERGKADAIIEVARQAGATGATVIYGRGTATHELLSLFNIQVNALKEIILIVADSGNHAAILKAVVDKGKLEEPGTGIAFTIPVDELIGLDFRSK